MKNPLVSVLMTSYNREKYIAEAIKSVINSTYQHWELIIVDDGSNDHTVSIARSFEKQDNRIKVYINEKNLGDYPNRNKAASYAKGKYLKYVDADDLIYPFCLEQMVWYMERNSEAAFGISSQRQNINNFLPLLLSPYEAYKMQYFEKGIFDFAPSFTIIRNDIFQESGGFTGKRMVGDFEFWHILSRNHPVLLLPEGLIWYRVHDGQEMDHYKSDPGFPFQYTLIAGQMLNHENCPLRNNTNLLHQAIEKIRKRESRQIFSALKHHSPSKALQLMRSSSFTGVDVVLYFIKSLLMK